MFSEYNDADALFDAIRKDRVGEGPNAFTLDRYPVRFVLFDNFHDSYAFVLKMIQDLKIQVEHMEHWAEDGYHADVLISQQRLGQKIKNYIRQLDGESKVLAPFSEIARFYDNRTRSDFDVLIRTVKGIEASQAGWDKHQRIYIPLVGLEGKMSPFFNDTQMTIWHLHSSEEGQNYRVILTNQTTYGVKHIERCYTIVHNVNEWLGLWQKKDAHYRKHLICSSAAIYANNENACPDNAFAFCTCDNAYDFLTKGLNFPFRGFDHHSEDDAFWEELAGDLDFDKMSKVDKDDLPQFDFTDYFAHHFKVNGIDDYKGFLKLWFDYRDNFSRWLLVNTYFLMVGKDNYTGRVLSRLNDYADQSLFSAYALEINDDANDMAERRGCLNDGARRGIVLTVDVENELGKLLCDKATTYGHCEAIKLFTSITNKEKILAITWLGKGLIKREDVESFYPELYHYLDASIGTTDAQKAWVLSYMDQYKTAKIANRYDDAVESAINEINADAETFYTWYAKFDTTYQQLCSRGDIEVYYWIDGLGIDWMPLISYIIDQHSRDKVYLNDVSIASAKLPTVTLINKVELEKLRKDGATFQKIGDIDKMAHEKQNLYPYNVIAEIEAVCEAVNRIIDQYQGKKIAIISDHGLSALSQYRDGLNLKGFTPHHFGRYAMKDNGKIVQDTNYFVCEDGKTVCALKHCSLCARIANGTSAHGGCTPEEVLVPIMIISSSKNNKTWTLHVDSTTLNALDPVLRLHIAGLHAADNPKISYNGQNYDILADGNDNYHCTFSNLDANVTTCTFSAGGFTQTIELTIKTGAVEDDPFADLGL